MLCAQVFCRDRSCELCRTSRRWLIAILTTAAALVTVAVVVLVLLVSGGCARDDDDDACEPTPHLDTTGNSIDCACDCDGDDACPLIPGTERSRVPDCWEDDDAR